VCFFFLIRAKGTSGWPSSLLLFGSEWRTTPKMKCDAGGYTDSFNHLYYPPDHTHTPNVYTYIRIKVYVCSHLNIVIDPRSLGNVESIMNELLHSRP